MIEESDKEQTKSAFNPMVEGVRWSERYADKMDLAWSFIPKRLSHLLATIAIFVLASGLQGNWIVIVVHFLKHIGYFNEDLTKNSSHSESDQLPFELPATNSNGSWLYFVTCSIIGSYVIYFGLGGFLHWYFYVKQRNNAHEWKCQPEKFLPADLEIHEIILGSVSLLCCSVFTGTISWYAANDGTYTKVYYEFGQYGWTWLFLQIPVVFLFQDYGAYLTHRMYHIPFLYKHFHKMHHKYKQPTAFSVTAIHPIEIIHMQCVLVAPIVLFPVHWLPFYAIALYTYYHAIIDHSGITFKAQWWQPWQPDAIFHDNHHQYTHVNFGFNCSFWDKFHGTYRNKYRIYSEDIFYGKGKALDEVSEEVLQRDLAERKSENPLAYKGNVNLNELAAKDVGLTHRKPPSVAPMH